jgi:hypothetical protein
MGMFDDPGATISSIGATVSSAANGLVTGAQNALGSITAKIGSGLPSLSGLSGLAGTPGVVQSGVTLPLSNPLFSYASYNCILGLGILTVDELNSPDTTYRAGKPYHLICKSGSIDPANRIQIPYGKFEFYIDDLQLQSNIGAEAGANTNVKTMSFKILEPYSMGLFFLTLQQAGFNTGHDNWRDAPLVLSIEFKGNKENGTMETIPNTSRYIPIHLSQIEMTVNEQGAVYEVKANAWDQDAITDAYAKFKGDVAAAGTTVQEMLQTGDKSLQIVMNRKLKETADKMGWAVPDQIAIIFPKTATTAGSTSSAPTGSSSDDSSTPTPTTLPSDGATISADILTKLKVNVSSTNGLVQDPSDCNDIGKAKMGFNETRKGDAPVGKDNKVYNSDTGIMDRSQNTINSNKSDMKFSQDTDVINAINQVILQSKFCQDTFDPSKLTPEGYRGWWTIDTHFYLNGDTDNGGQKPKIIVYRILPYFVHNESGPIVDKPVGYDQLIKQAVKVYDYIYTGKNVDVLKFEIKYNAAFTNVLAADGNSGTQGNQTAANSGGADPKGGLSSSPTPDVAPPKPALGENPNTNRPLLTKTSTDKYGGGGAETQGIRAARVFHDAITKANGADMQTLSLDIIGDPYWIAQSGTGNYSSEQTEHANLNADGSVNYQSGEVDCVVNFRTPVDINQSTGLYDFGGGATTPVMAFSGLYRIYQVRSSFNKGEFKQTLIGNRRQMQESKAQTDASTVYNGAREVKKPNDVTGDVNYAGDTGSSEGQ